MKKANKITLNGTCNWRAIGTLVVITLCLTGVMSPAMTQSALSLLNNASNATDSETGDIPEPASTPVPSPTPTQSPSPGPSPSPSPTPIPTPTPSPAAPNITSFTPDSPVYDTEGATRTFNISTDQVVNVSWIFNGTEVQTNESVTEASYTNTSPAVGIWNITAVATNENGTVMQTWVWNVSPQATPLLTPTPTSMPGPTPSPSPITTPTPTQILASDAATLATPFFIYGFVYYENGDKCYNPVVNVTNVNASKSWEAKTSSTSNYFQLIEVMNISAGNVLEFNVTDGVGYNTTNRTIVQDDINKGVIDFDLTHPVLAPIINNINLTDDDLSTPGVQVINPNRTKKTVTITANVTDLSGEDLVNISVIANITGPSVVEDSPVSLVFVSNSSATTAIYNGTFNMSNHSEGVYKVVVNATNTEGFTGTGSKNFTYSYGPDLIITNISTPFYLIANESNTINATIRNNGTARAVEFNVSLSANDSLGTVTISSLNASANKTVNFSWIPKQEGNYILTVMADSEHEVTESNETNNNRTRTAVLVGVPDFTVHEIYMFINGTELDVNDTIWDSDTVNINATILNNGTREGNCAVEFWDVKNMSFKRTYVNVTDGYQNFSQRGTDVIVQPNASEMRVHFSYIYVKGEGSYIDVYDNNDSINRSFTPTDSYYIDEWVNCSGDLVRIESNASNDWNACVLFEVDKYEALIGNKTVTINAGGNETITANLTATTGNHTLFVRAIPLVPDCNKSNNENEKKVPHVRPSRDFKVANISIVPQSPFVGANVTINATIENLGNRSGNVTVEFFLENDTTAFNTTSVFVNAADETTNGTNYAEVVWKNAEPPGEHTITVIADPLNIIDEIDDTNNKNETTIFVDAMDFTITGLEPTPPTPVFGENVTINATIKNIGNGSRNVSVGFYVDNQSFAFANRTVDASVRGKSYNATVNWTAGIAGCHTITARVDHDKTITELDESNNDKSIQIFVNGTDLAVLDIGIIPGEVYDDIEQVNVTLKAIISNQGAIDASNFSVSFKDNDTVINNISVPGLNASDSTQVNTSWIATFGTHNISVKIYTDINKENDITNNEMNRTNVEILPDVDFTVSNITFSPVNPKEGETVTINATIKNLGNRSGNIKVDFYVDDNSIPFETNNTYIDVNGTNYTTAIWNAMPDINYLTPGHNITVVVDHDNKIIESNETNNAATEQINIIMSDMSITNTSIDPPHPTVGDFVNVTAAIKNNGNETANSTVWFYEENKTDIRLCVRHSGEIDEKIITYPGASKIKINFTLGGDGRYLNIMDKDGKILDRYEGTFCGANPYWSTRWISGDTIRIELGAVHCLRTPGTAEAVTLYALFGNQSIESLGQNNWTNVTFGWNLTHRAHRRWVMVNDAERDYKTETDLAVTSIYLPGVDEYTLLGEDRMYKVYKEDKVNITANITNLGVVNATNFNVKFYNDGSLIGTNKSLSLDANKTMQVECPTLWNVTTSNSPQTINVTIIPGNNPESNIANNTKQMNVKVGSCWDFAVTNISFYNKSFYLIDKPEEGEEVIINATIKNSGTRNERVNVSFYVDGIEDYEKFIVIGTPVNTSVYVPAGEEKYATANWTAKPDINHLTAEHEIIVWVDPDNKYPEGTDEDNNINSTEIRINESLEIISVTLNPENPVYNESVVDINATIRNKGNKSVNATVWFYSEKEIYLTAKVENDGTAPGTRNDHITQPDALMMRVHLSELKIQGDGHLVVYNGSDEPVNRSMDDGWTDWAFGHTIRIESYAKGDPHGRKNIVNCNINKYQAFIGKNDTTIIAGENKTFTANWNATPTIINQDAKIGNCTINVWVVNTTYSKDVYINGTDLAVNFTLNDTYFDGDQVPINVTIINLGAKNASNFSVWFKDNGEIFFTKTNLSLPAGNATIVNATWTARVFNKNNESHTITVGVDAQHNIENNNTNNVSVKVVHVNVSRDFSISNVSFKVNNETRAPDNVSGKVQLVVGMNVTLNAMVNVTNLANSGGNVSVGFYLDDNEGRNHLINKAFVNKTFDRGNGTIHVELDWHVDNFDDVEVPGDHNLTVVADPGNKTIEFNESNNATIPIRIYARAADLTVSNISFERLDKKKEPIIPGVVVNITAKVENIGEENATDVTVQFKIAGPFYSCKYDETVLTPDKPISFLNAGNYSYVNVSWTTEYAGQYEITVTADPDGNITEFNEGNNSKIESLIVQGPDLTVSSMRLIRLDNNGTETEIGENETIPHGEWVKIIANVSNIGVKRAKGIEVEAFKKIKNTGKLESINTVPPMSLAQGGTKNDTFVALWHAKVGDTAVGVVVDPEDKVIESNETNNETIRPVRVWAADLIVSNITFTVIPPENAIPAATNAIYDTDNVMINATIVNRGILPAKDFNVEMFNGYKLEDFVSPSEFGGWYSVVRTKEGASCIYIHVEEIRGFTFNIYDKNDNLVQKVENSCWVRVLGDRVRIHGAFGDKNYAKVHFYAGNKTEINIPSISANGWKNISMTQQRVGTGDYLCRVVADPEPENRVIEHNESNNNASKPMRVFPSRDFTIVNLKVNSRYLWDGDTVMVNATVKMNINESDPYHEYRKGITDVDVIDEHWWVEPSLPSRYKEEELTLFGYGYNITYPGADAIRVRFQTLNINTFSGGPEGRDGSVYIRDRNGTIVQEWSDSHTGGAFSEWVPGDTAYIYTTAKCDNFTASNLFISGYQYRKINRTSVVLNATETENITTEWNPSAWDHNIYVTIDPDNKTGEIDESNNELYKPLEVIPCKDPAVVNISFEPQSPVPRDSSVNVTACIANYGNKTANFSVDLWAEKDEDYSYESPHYISPEGFTKTITTYPEANWTGVHFDTLSLRNAFDTRRLQVQDKYGNISAYYHTFNGNNIWAWVKGDTAELTMLRHDTFDGVGGDVWGCSVDKVAHRIILNHTFISLGPGNTTNVSGILPQARFGNGSFSYTIYAVVDMDNVVYEKDEWNNENITTLNIRVPDLTVSGIEYKSGKIWATIKNEGLEEARNVTVRFQRDVELEFPDVWRTSESIWEKDADMIRVHVESLSVTEKNGSLVIYNRTFKKEYKECDEKGFWSPWLAGASIALSSNEASFKVDRYEYRVDEPVGNFAIGEPKEGELPVREEGPYTHKFRVEKLVNEVYNLTVFVDAEDEIRESNEANNDKKKMIGPDLKIENITFLDEDRDEVDPDRLIVIEKYTVKVEVKNMKGDRGDDKIACVAAENFEVAFYVNTSDNVTIFSDTQPISQRLSPGDPESVVLFSSPSSKLKLNRGFYSVKAVVDSNKIVSELKEDNNTMPITNVKVAEPGYKADKPLHVLPSGEIHGGMYYDIGDSKYKCSKSRKPDINVTINFTNKIPAGATVELAWLYLYMWSHTNDPEHPGFDLAELPEIGMHFNGYPVDKDKDYEDFPDAASKNWSYATLCYNVKGKDIYPGSELQARAVFNKTDDTMEYGISGMGLVVVYEKDDAPLIRYFIAEGGDVIMAKNEIYKTGFEYEEECTSDVWFNAVNDPHLANTTLITVLAPYAQEVLCEGAGGKGDLLRFHGDEVGEPIDNGHWGYIGNSNIALTKNEERGEYVEVQQNNLAQIQSRGNYFFLTNVFLNVTYPPDLVPCLEKLPIEAVVGNTYDIPVAKNIGRSEAHNFSVSFYVNGELTKKHVDVIEGGNISKEYFQWQPRSPGVVVNITVVVDSDSDVDELINSQGNGEMNNKDMRNIPVGLGEWEQRPPGGGGRIKEKGFGEDVGAIEGEGAWTKAGSGEATAGKREGEAITGYLMKGSVAQGEAGGGGKSKSEEFSMLGLLMRIATLAAAVSLVFAGYLLERRRQNNKLSLEKKV